MFWIGYIAGFATSFILLAIAIKWLERWEWLDNKRQEEYRRQTRSMYSSIR